MKRGGYSLVELMVVMSIIAILSLLGMGAFITIRNNSEVDKAAEEILSTIRQAQNNSLAVKKDPKNNNSKVWSTYIGTKDDSVNNKNSVGLVSFYTPSGNPNVLNKCDSSDGCLPLTKFSKVDITISNDLGSTYPYGYISYATPFANNTLLFGLDCLNARCSWTTNTKKPTKEWFVITEGVPEVSSINNNSTQKMHIIIKSINGKYSREIVVSNNGDAYLQ